MDEELRELERRAAAGDADAQRRLEQARLRSDQGARGWELELRIPSIALATRWGTNELALVDWKGDAHVTDGNTIRRVGGEHHARALAFSTKGDVLRVTDDAFVATPAEGPERRMPLPLSKVSVAAFDRTGSLLAISDGHALMLMGGAAPSWKIAEAATREAPIWHLSFSADATWLAQCAPGSVVFRRVSDGQVVGAPIRLEDEIHYMAQCWWVGDDRAIVSLGRGSLWAVTPREPALVPLELPAETHPDVCAAADDGRLLLPGSLDGFRVERLLVTSLRGARLEPLVELIAPRPGDAIFLGDGRRLVLGYRFDPVLRAIDITPEPDGAVRRIQLEVHDEGPALMYGAPPTGPAQDFDFSF